MSEYRCRVVERSACFAGKIEDFDANPCSLRRPVKVSSFEPQWRICSVAMSSAQPQV